MKTVWKGAVQFGLVSIPVRIYAATEDRSPSFHQLHEKDLGRIRYQRVCSECGEEVPFEDIIRGYELDRDRYVPVTEEEIEAAAVPSTRSLEIDRFVELEEIDPAYFERAYYMVPEELGAKAYHLLEQVLEQTERVAVGKISFHGKEHLAAIRAVNGILTLDTMRWPDEIREAPTEEIPSEDAPEKKDLAMAQNLIDNLTEEWDPSAFQDEYRKALGEIIEKKAAGETVEVKAAEGGAEVIDLTEALEKSLKSTKKGTGRGRKKAKGKAKAKEAKGA